MSALGNIDQKLTKLKIVLNQSSSFPYSVEGERINGFSVSNDSDTDDVSVFITDIRGQVIEVPVGIGKNFSAITETMRTINVGGASANYTIALFSGG